ncbi:MAG: GNAT family N-acetyltransferase [Hyphomicrobiaceae bacterium]
MIDIDNPGSSLGRHHIPLHENDAELVAAFVQLFADFRDRELIRNLDVAVEQLSVGEHSFPMTLNDACQVPNCYICCPSTAYIDYALDELRNFEAHPFLSGSLRKLIRACQPLLSASGLDHQVQVNNWLYSTNPVPELERNVIRTMRDDLIERFPDRAIIIRSLNEIADAGTIAALKAEGFDMLASRQIYIFTGDNLTARHRRYLSVDSRLIETTPYERVDGADFTAEDFERCETLYNMLYLEKYTPLNPQYSSAYIREMHARGIMKLVGLRNTDGVLDGVTGLFENGATLTQPIVGYDTSRPQELGLYRMVMMIAQQHAIANGRFFNMSAGAAEFKRNRGAVPAIEYSAVFNRHLGRRKRAATRLLRDILRLVGIPMLRRFEL